MEAMKKKCLEIEDLTKEQNLEIEKQKQKYDELQVRIYLKTNVVKLWFPPME